MAIRVGRLQPVGFVKRGAAPTVPVTPGTFITPTQFPRWLPDWNWYPEITLLESPAISAVRELPVKAVKGPASLEGFKLNAELEPTDVFGNLFMAGFGSDTVTGDGIASVRAHNFEALQSAQLPTYDWWHEEGDKEFGFGGMMCSKWDLFMPAKEMVRLEEEWVGLYHVDGLALSPVLSYPAQRPLTFAQIDVTLGGVLVTNLTMAHLSVENAAVADHTLRSDTNFANRMWTEHFLATAEFDTFFEDATEYNKFLAASSPSTPTPTSLDVVVTSAETFTDGPTQAYIYRFKIVTLDYRTAEVPLPSGVIKGKFTGVALPGSGTIGSGGNAYAFTNRSLVARLENGVAAAY
jgi:hypothetical protein